jgi:hypothetical protein
VVKDGVLFGRGACDMKGGIAAFIAGLTDFLATRPDHQGSISLLITGDEEARSIDGTAKVLEWMQANGQIPDMALVGEPTSRATLGDVVKIGRRGSLTAQWSGTLRLARSTDDSRSGSRGQDRFRTERRHAQAQLAWRAGPALQAVLAAS